MAKKKGDLYTVQVYAGRKKWVLVVKGLKAASRAARQLLIEHPEATYAEVVRTDGEKTEVTL
jgi:hypothetical protein